MLLEHVSVFKNLGKFENWEKKTNQDFLVAVSDAIANKFFGFFGFFPPRDRIDFASFIYSA